METWKIPLPLSSRPPLLASAHSNAVASSAVFARRCLQSPISSMDDQNYDMNGKIVIFSLAILCFLVLIIILLRIHARRLRCSSSVRSPRHHHSLFPAQDTPLTGGLDKEIVGAFPVFGFKSKCLSTSTKTLEAVECAVCLSVFQQNETCRLLPRCKHFFHIDCIDMWFLSNTTCPLCRTAADAVDCGEVHDVAGSTSCCFTIQDGGNELGERYQRAVVPTSGTRGTIACGNSKHDWEKQGDTRLRGYFPLQSPSTSQSYRRSKSEKFCRSTQGAPLPSNGLMCGNNHTHSTAHMNPTHWQTGARSFSHTTIDILKPQESPAGVSGCPTLPSSSEPCSTLPHLVHRPVNEHE